MFNVNKGLAPPRPGGFTLVELLVTLAVAAILATLAAPSFQQFVLNQRVRNASYDLMAALALTRNEAIIRNADVTLSMATGGWVNGWVIDAGGTELRRWGPYQGLSLTMSTNSVTFRRDGRLSAASQPVFAVDDGSSNADVKVRCIRVDLSGRPNNSLSESGSCG